MKLNITELGIIKRIQIDLDKKFMLFCGLNGTGKTYASYILHYFLDRNYILNYKWESDIIRQIGSDGCFTIKREYLEDWLNAYCKQVELELGDIFGVSDATKDKLFPDFLLNVDYTNEDFAKSLKTNINAKLTGGTSVWVIKKASDSDLVYVESDLDISNLNPAKMFLASVLVNNIIRHLVFCDNSNARMLTVERNSIYTFKTELSLSRNEAFDQLLKAGQNEKSDKEEFDIVKGTSRRYPRAIKSSLNIANDLENVQKQVSPFAEVAELIEKDMLLGSVNMTKNGDVEFCADGMLKSKKLPFHLSSSIVKTMASLVIYLKHIAKIGDTLIIDEPEMNFHPNVQIILAKIFALLSNRGLRVVVSTHSDYIVREINNLIMAGAINKKNNSDLPIELGYQKEMLLDYTDVDVLFFKKTGKTAVRVESLPLNEEGFAVETIDDAIQQQNQNARLLYDLLIEENPD